VVNNIISDLTEKIQQEFEKIPTEKIYITLGNLTGNYLLSGFGPRIPIKISMTGSVDTEIKSEFISQGINQTLHRVYVNFNCDMAVVTPMKRYNQNVVNQFIIAEHVIVGNIPNAYYNLEGIEKPSNTINLMK
ncbi:MAG: sporulation protein YunB, partial [Clostridia bacterium]